MQYSTFSPRMDGKEVKFGESQGGFGFGFLDSKIMSFPELDPRIGQITVDTV